MGGLGNQLFQVYTTMALSMEMKMGFIFPRNKLVTDKRSCMYWTSFLKELNKNATMKDIKTLTYTVYKEKEFKYEKIQLSPELIRKTGGVLLYGYFQSYKYFDKECKNISQYIKLDESRQLVRNTYYKKYENQNVISVHFRMGDYKHLQNCHPILSNEYYINSIKFILNNINSRIPQQGITQQGITQQGIPQQGITQQETKKWTILYFCEDEDFSEIKKRIELIKSGLRLDSETDIERILNLEFERGGNDSKQKMEDWQQLLLMSCCDHNIIANSSYSWWAAYFNNSIDKIVCYPEIWFGPQLLNHDTKDLCPTSWNKIKS